MRFFDRCGGCVADGDKTLPPVRAHGGTQQRRDIDRRGRGGNRQAHTGGLRLTDQRQYAWT